MTSRLIIIAPILMVFACNISIADEDSRQLVELPEMMQLHMMSNMHRAASRFALRVQERGTLPACSALAEVTSACVEGHSNYRIR